MGRQLDDCHDIPGDNGPLNSTPVVAERIRMACLCVLERIGQCDEQQGDTKEESLNGGGSEWI